MGYKREDEAAIWKSRELGEHVRTMMILRDWPKQHIPEGFAFHIDPEDHQNQYPDFPTQIHVGVLEAYLPQIQRFFGVDTIKELNDRRNTTIKQLSMMMWLKKSDEKLRQDRDTLSVHLGLVLKCVEAYDVKMFERHIDSLLEDQILALFGMVKDRRLAHYEEMMWRYTEPVYIEHNSLKNCFLCHRNREKIIMVGRPYEAETDYRICDECIENIINASGMTIDEIIEKSKPYVTNGQFGSSLINCFYQTSTKRIEQSRDISRTVARLMREFNEDIAQLLTETLDSPTQKTSPQPLPSGGAAGVEPASEKC